MPKASMCALEVALDTTSVTKAAVVGFGVATRSDR